MGAHKKGKGSGNVLERQRDIEVVGKVVLLNRLGTPGGYGIVRTENNAEFLFNLGSFAGNVLGGKQVAGLVTSHDVKADSEILLKLNAENKLDAAYLIRPAKGCDSAS